MTSMGKRIVSILSPGKKVWYRIMIFQRFFNVLHILCILCCLDTQLYKIYSIYLRYGNNAREGCQGKVVNRNLIILELFGAVLLNFFYTAIANRKFIEFGLCVNSPACFEMAKRLRL